MDDSGRTHPGKPESRRRFHHKRRDRGHAAMIRRASAQETRAAIGLLLDDGATRSHGCSAVRVGGTEHSNDRKAHCGRDMHRARIITDEEMTL